jgi:hypothetical protein
MACLRQFTILLSVLGVSALTVPPLGEDSAVVHYYALEGSAELPQYGVAHLASTCRLAEAGREEGGVRLMRLAFDAPPVFTDQYGLRHRLPKPFHVHRFPFYYRQSRDGTLLDVLHHQDDSWQSVAAKKDMVGAHQLVVHHDLGWRGGAWTSVENDVGGSGVATYSVQATGSHMHVSKHLVYEEEERWLHRTVNTTGMVALNGTVHAIHIQGETRVTAEEGHDGVQRLSGAEMIPSRPVSTTWTLISLEPESESGRRRLHHTPCAGRKQPHARVLFSSIIMPLAVLGALSRGVLPRWIQRRNWSRAQSHASTEKRIWTTSGSRKRISAGVEGRV